MPTDPKTSPLPLTPTPAAADDAAEILQLRNCLVDWMQDRGISQSHRGDVSEERIRQQAEAGQWWLIRSDTRSLIAAVRILNEDPRIWGEPDRRAMHVRGLMVDRHQAGQGLGRQLLGWASEYGRSQGAEVLRLDCVATNLGRCNYYWRHGLTRVGNERTAAAMGVGRSLRTADAIHWTKIRTLQ